MVDSASASRTGADAEVSLLPLCMDLAAGLPARSRWEWARPDLAMDLAPMASGLIYEATGRPNLSSIYGFVDPMGIMGRPV